MASKIDNIMLEIQIIDKFSAELKKYNTGLGGASSNTKKAGDEITRAHKKIEEIQTGLTGDSAKQQALIIKRKWDSIISDTKNAYGVLIKEAKGNRDKQKTILEQYKKDLDSLNVAKLKDLGSIDIKTTGFEKLSKSLFNINPALDELKFNMSGIIGNLNLFTGGFIAVSTAISTFAKSVIAGLDSLTRLEAGLSETLSLMDTASQVKFGTEFENGLRRISVTSGDTFDSLTKGLYNAVSAGIEAGEAITFLESASRAAVAGVSDTNTVVDIGTTVLNAFKNEGLSSSQVFDVLFQGIKKGKTTMSELNQYFGQVASTAATAGVSFANVVGTIAELTAKGQKTPIAVTSINALLEKFTNKDTVDIFKSIGVEILDLNGNVRDLGKIFTDVSKLNLSNLQISSLNLGGEANDAFKSLLDTVQVEGGNVVSSLEKTLQGFDVSKVAGSMESAFSVITQTTANQEKRIEQLTEVSLQNVAKPFTFLEKIYNDTTESILSSFVKLTSSSAELADMTKGQTDNYRNLSNTAKEIFKDFINLKNANISLSEKQEGFLKIITDIEKISPNVALRLREIGEASGYSAEGFEKASIEIAKFYKYQKILSLASFNEEFDLLNSSIDEFRSSIEYSVDAMLTLRRASGEEIGFKNIKLIGVENSTFSASVVEAQNAIESLKSSFNKLKTGISLEFATKEQLLIADNILKKNKELDDVQNKLNSGVISHKDAIKEQARITQEINKDKKTMVEIDSQLEKFANRILDNYDNMQDIEKNVLSLIDDQYKAEALRNKVVEILHQKKIDAFKQELNINGLSERTYNAIYKTISDTANIQDWQTKNELQKLEIAKEELAVRYKQLQEIRLFTVKMHSEAVGDGNKIMASLYSGIIQATKAGENMTKEAIDDIESRIAKLKSESKKIPLPEILGKSKKKRNDKEIKDYFSELKREIENKGVELQAEINLFNVGDVKKQLNQATKEFESYKDKINELKLKGDITQSQSNQLIALAKKEIQQRKEYIALYNLEKSAAQSAFDFIMKFENEKLTTFQKNTKAITEEYKKIEDVIKPVIEVSTGKEKQQLIELLNISGKIRDNNLTKAYNAELDNIEKINIAKLEKIEAEAKSDLKKIEDKYKTEKAFLDKLKDDVLKQDTGKSQEQRKKIDDEYNKSLQELENKKIKIEQEQIQKRKQTYIDYIKAVSQSDKELLDSRLTGIAKEISDLNNKYTEELKLLNMSDIENKDKQREKHNIDVKYHRLRLEMIEKEKNKNLETLDSFINSSIERYNDLMNASIGSSDAFIIQFDKVTKEFKDLQIKAQKELLQVSIAETLKGALSTTVTTTITSEGAEEQQKKQIENLKEIREQELALNNKILEIKKQVIDSVIEDEKKKIREKQELELHNIKNITEQQIKMVELLDDIQKKQLEEIDKNKESSAQKELDNYNKLFFNVTKAFKDAKIEIPVTIKDKKIDDELEAVIKKTPKGKIQLEFGESIIPISGKQTGNQHLSVLKEFKDKQFKTEKEYIDAIEKYAKEKNYKSLLANKKDIENIAKALVSEKERIKKAVNEIQTEIKKEIEKAPEIKSKINFDFDIENIEKNTGVFAEKMAILQQKINELSLDSPNFQDSYKEQINAILSMIPEIEAELNKISDEKFKNRYKTAINEITKELKEKLSQVSGAKTPEATFEQDTKQEVEKRISKNTQIQAIENQLHFLSQQITKGEKIIEMQSQETEDVVSRLNNIIGDIAVRLATEIEKKPNIQANKLVSSVIEGIKKDYELSESELKIITGIQQSLIAQIQGMPKEFDINVDTDRIKKAGEAFNLQLLLDIDKFKKLTQTQKEALDDEINSLDSYLSFLKSRIIEFQSVGNKEMEANFLVLSDYVEKYKQKLQEQYQEQLNADKTKKQKKDLDRILVLEKEIQLLDSKLSYETSIYELSQSEKGEESKKEDVFNIEKEFLISKIELLKEIADLQEKELKNIKEKPTVAGQENQKISEIIEQEKNIFETRRKIVELQNKILSTPEITKKKEQSVINISDIDIIKSRIALLETEKSIKESNIKLDDTIKDKTKELEKIEKSFLLEKVKLLEQVKLEQRSELALLQLREDEYKGNNEFQKLVLDKENEIKQTSKSILELQLQLNGATKEGLDELKQYEDKLKQFEDIIKRQNEDEFELAKIDTDVQLEKDLDFFKDYLDVQIEINGQSMTFGELLKKNAEKQKKAIELKRWQSLANTITSVANSVTSVVNAFKSLANSNDVKSVISNIGEMTTQAGNLSNAIPGGQAYAPFIQAGGAVISMFSSFFSSEAEREAERKQAEEKRINDLKKQIELSRQLLEIQKEYIDRLKELGIIQKQTNAELEKSILSIGIETSTGVDSNIDSMRDSLNQARELDKELRAVQEDESAIKKIKGYEELTDEQAKAFHEYSKTLESNVSNLIKSFQDSGLSVEQMLFLGFTVDELRQAGINITSEQAKIMENSSKITIENFKEIGKSIADEIKEIDKQIAKAESEGADPQFIENLRILREAKKQQYDFILEMRENWLDNIEKQNERQSIILDLQDIPNLRSDDVLRDIEKVGNNLEAQIEKMKIEGIIPTSFNFDFESLGVDKNKLKEYIIDPLKAPTLELQELFSDNTFAKEVSKLFELDKALISANIEDSLHEIQSDTDFAIQDSIQKLIKSQGYITQSQIDGITKDLEESQSEKLINFYENTLPTLEKGSEEHVKVFADYTKVLTKLNLDALKQIEDMENAKLDSFKDRLEKLSNDKNLQDAIDKLYNIPENLSIVKDIENLNKKNSILQEQLQYMRYIGSSEQELTKLQTEIVENQIQIEELKQRELDVSLQLITSENEYNELKAKSLDIDDRAQAQLRLIGLEKVKNELETQLQLLNSQNSSMEKIREVESALFNNAIERKDVITEIQEINLKNINASNEYNELKAKSLDMDDRAQAQLRLIGLEKVKNELETQLQLLNSQNSSMEKIREVESALFNNAIERKDVITEIQEINIRNINASIDLEQRELENYKKRVMLQNNGILNLEQQYAIEKDILATEKQGISEKLSLLKVQSKYTTDINKQNEIESEMLSIRSRILDIDLELQSIENSRSKIMIEAMDNEMRFRDVEILRLEKIRGYKLDEFQLDAIKKENLIIQKKELEKIIQQMQYEGKSAQELLEYQERLLNIDIELTNNNKTKLGAIDEQISKYKKQSDISIKRLELEKGLELSSSERNEIIVESIDKQINATKEALTYLENQKAPLDTIQDYQERLLDLQIEKNKALKTELDLNGKVDGQLKSLYIQRQKISVLQLQGQTVPKGQIEAIESEINKRLKELGLAGFSSGGINPYPLAYAHEGEAIFNKDSTNELIKLFGKSNVLDMSQKPNRVTEILSKSLINPISGIPSISVNFGNIIISGQNQNAGIEIENKLKNINWSDIFNKTLKQYGKNIGMIG